MMSEELDDAFWDKYMGTDDAEGVYDGGVATLRPYQRLLDEVVEALALEEGGAVLDPGCGTGNLTLRMFANQPNIGRVIGVDDNAHAIKAAERKIDNDRVRFMHKKADDAYLPEYVEGGVDRIACVNALYAFDKPRRFLASCRSMLQDDGLFVCTNAYRPFMDRVIGSHELWLATQATDEERSHDEAHVRQKRYEAIRMNMRIVAAMRGKRIHAWSPEVLEHELTMAGFTVLLMRDDAYAGINTFCVAKPA